MAIELDPNNVQDHRNTTGAVGGRHARHPGRPPKLVPHKRDHAKRARSRVGAGAVTTKFRIPENPRGFEPYCSPAANGLDSNDLLGYGKCLKPSGGARGTRGAERMTLDHDARDPA